MKEIERYKKQLYIEIDSVENFIESSIETYIRFIKVAKEKGYESVCDIGCASGVQKYLFDKEKIGYLGVDDSPSIFSRQFNVIKYSYPFENSKEILNKYGNKLAISSLCLGWEVYKKTDNEFDKQFKALSEDFKASLLYIPQNRYKLLKKYFKNIEIIELHENKIDLSKYGIYYCFN